MATQPAACPECTGALSTPRISLVDLKPPVTAHPSTCGVPWVGAGGYLEGGIPGTGRVVYREGGIPDTTHPSSRPVHWYCQGPTTSPSPRFCVHQGTPRARLALSAHPGSSHSTCPSWPIRARFHVNILKLVIKPECHRKTVMRPAIVPISKTGSNVTTLNFQDFPNG